MSSKRFPPPPMPPAPQFDPSMATDVKCNSCGNYAFEQIYLLKHVPALASPNGKAGIIPIPTFSCRACGGINDELIPPIYRKKTEEGTSAERPAAFDVTGASLPKAEEPKKEELKSSIIQIVN